MRGLPAAFLLAALLSGLPAAAAEAVYPPVVEGRAMVFPDDTGAHPEYRTEWWYVTGWLVDGQGAERGFQITFFRIRTAIGEDNPSRFAPSQLIAAHAAVSDPRIGRLLHAERAERAVAPLAGAATGRTQVQVGDWSLELLEDRYVGRIDSEAFGLDLSLALTGDPVPNGRAGFSRKAPDPLNASYYYSRPQLAVSGSLRVRGTDHAVTGRAWLDHEWSSELLPEAAAGWDWIGVNLHDGGSLMAFQMRGHDGAAIWNAGTLRGGDGEPRILDPDEVGFEARRWWSSARTGVRYPVEWLVRAGGRELHVRPLMDDQELDGRSSVGALYWEGAVSVFEDGEEVGRGYLEMTGYGERLRM